MASAVMARDDDMHVDVSMSPMTRSPRDASPATLPLEDGDIDMQKAAYISSPLRAEEGLDTLPELPRAPNNNGPLRVNTLHAPAQPPTDFAPPSFPFNASPGTVGPSPTTKDLSNPADAATSGGMARKRPIRGTSTPPDRRSVQFARGTNDELGPTPLSKTATLDMGESEDEHAIRDRQSSASFFTKLKALASSSAPSQQHGRTSSSVTTAPETPNAALSPQSERSEPLYEIPSESAEAAIDGDEDLSSDENEATGDLRARRRRKSKRPTYNGTESLPSTPRASRFASFMRDHPIPGTSNSARPPASSRRATVSDMEDNSRAGVSEDEGRDRLRTAWRKGIEGARGLSYAARKDREGAEGTEPKRPGNLRRITGFGGTDSGPSQFRQRADRHNSASVAKWRQVKAGLKMLGQRQRNERTKIDHQKSAQLMAELLAGAPAALMFASMFLRDEHSRQKVPVLLEQLKISIPEVNSRTDKKGDRDYIFKVDLEYGNGPARMEWTIYRSVIDFVNLHAKYKTEQLGTKVRHLRSEDKTKPKIPRFPKSVIPYARGMRGLFEKLQDEDDEQDAPEAPPTPGALDGTLNANTSSTIGTPTRPIKGHKRQQSSFAAPRRQSTSEIGNHSADPDALTARQRQIYAERSRQKLETYLQQMIRWLIFRPESTRLCKFLEVSAMAIRLSAENGYQGKQGLLQIASRRQRGQQGLHRTTLQTLTPHAVKERHKRRWFLVRHSYVVCVDGPESLTPYDVFLVDSDFSIAKPRKRIIDQKTPKDIAKTATENATPARKAHLIQLHNAERKLKLYARNEKQYLQFQESLNQMLENTVWSQKQRFSSYAPVRNKVWARWLVDGRDHMWQVSRAIDNAKDFIYIHDWWLSPELYMRRPAAISQKWRLDRLLQRKAQEGVKIFVIVYRNIESAIPIDSEYTKWSLLDLHPNICVQRSPNQFRQNQFFWAHHEKLVVVDNMMAFVGGIDLCFGRWDDPCHTLTDDKLTGFELDHDVPRDSEHCQVWPGKDYSNPRVQDFYALDRPYEEMYDRTKVPRMPWHDIAMQMVGQPARDVGRHFIQRWNYVLRSRVPSRPTPVLMPPPEYDQAELDRLGMTGTCQVQILRSCCQWSIGTIKVEHSIMNAYCALIRDSDHFVYIENQFFISSCTVEGVKINNQIGDAIVERAIRAHEKGEDWQMCLIIPLMPGFQNSVDAQDGSSVRLIMQCQFRSICRGESSIFGRLRAQGIQPENYVRFYSLRQWGKIGARKCLTTEQLYIHAKCMIVDDRHVIIGSANINERSMLGSRDSEVAALVTDTRMIPSFMGGKPYEVGEFPHSLRMRLMREHLGIDVDALYRREQLQAEAEREAQDAEMERIYRHDKFTPSKEYFETPLQTPLAPPIQLQNHNATGAGSAIPGQKEEPNGYAGTTQTGSSENLDHHETAKDLKRGEERDLDVEGYGFDNMKHIVDAGNVGLRDSYVDATGREILLKRDAPDTSRIKETEEYELSQQRSRSRERKMNAPARPPWPTERLNTTALGLPIRSQLPELPLLDDTDIGGPPVVHGEAIKGAAEPLLKSLRRPDVHEDCMADPLSTGFYKDIWHKVADNNTKIYRQVFRCQPDSDVLDWKAYEKANEYNEIFMQSQGLGKSTPRPTSDAPVKSGPPGFGGIAASPTDDSFAESVKRPKGVFGGLVDRLRPGSRVSRSTNTEGTNEMAARDRAAPGSPGSGVSSVPTMVPSPSVTPLDEKEASKQSSPPLNERRGSPLNEKEAAKQEDLAQTHTSGSNADSSLNKARTVQISDSVNHASETTATQSTPGNLQHSTSQKRRRRATTKSSARPVPEDMLGRAEAEELLQLVQGHLVLWPYDWLEKEERGSNWLYPFDQIAPLEIYD